MFHIAALAKFLFFFLLVSGGVSSTQLAGSAQLRPSQLEKRQVRQYLNIFKGLFRSKNIVKNISEIPCGLIQILENDADQAKTFIDQLQKGKVPSLIQQLPEKIPDDILGTLHDLIGIFEKLPSKIADAAQAAVTDAANIFDDIGSGAIVKDIENIGLIASDVTSAWGNLTTGFEDAWATATDVIACLFEDCPASTTDAHTCNGSNATTTSAGAAPTGSGPESTGTSPAEPTLIPSKPTTTAAPAQPPLVVPLATQTLPPTGGTRLPGPSASVKPSEGIQIIAQPRVFQLCWVVAVGVFGVALLL